MRQRYDFRRHTTSRPPKQNVIDNYGYAAMFRGGIMRMARAALVTLWHLVSFPAVLVRRRIDLVQVQSSDFQTFWESCLYLLTARAMGRPTLMRLGGIFDHFYEGSSPLLKRGIRAGVMLPDILIVQSEGWRRYLAGLGRTSAVLVLGNTVPADSIVRRKGPRNEPPVFVFVAGTEAVRKGAHVLLQALRSPLLREVDAVFRYFAVIEPLAQQFASAELEQEIEWQGYVSHEVLQDAMREADVFLLPSFGEGFPNSLLEAIAAGLAPVVTPVGAVPEIVTDEVEALFVPPGDANALAAAIARLASEPALIERLAEAAQARLGREFVAEVVLERLAGTYDALLEPRRP